MRTQKFERVFDRVVRKLGRDPLGEIHQDMARTIADHINDRVEQIFQAWDWPEWTLTEERAFRPVWNATHQWLKVNELGVQDEVFYLGDSFVNNGPFTANYGYYRVKSTAPTDPPIGTAPTNTTYWEAIEQPIDAYIAYDQTDQRAIGRVIGVYNANPRLNGCNGCCHGLYYRPSEKGIDVRCTGNPTVFITYIMPMPEYSIIAHAQGRTYQRGDVVFDPLTMECFQAVRTNATLPSSGDWIYVPFLQKWATFVVEGAYSDCLTELDQAGGKDDGRGTLAAAAEARAQLALEARVNELSAQGQVLKYSFCHPTKCGWCESLPFVSGGAVTTLTENPQGDAGWIVPAPIVPQQGFFYYPEVNSLKTTSPTLVATVPTTYMALKTIVKIFTAQEFRLDAGVANSADPGEGAPLDYDLAVNNKKWVEVL